MELVTWLMGALTLLTVTIGLSFVRVWRGPTLPDRVVALDILTTVGIGITAVYAVITEQDVWLDVATVLALISFLGTIAFAYYIDLRR
ncbi:MAG: cation:proton antiporter [Ardenticatenaceae bacterium]|nr:cation:proton antiporter [Ardenticatenaceae bacterium]